MSLQPIGDMYLLQLNPDASLSSYQAFPVHMMLQNATKGSSQYSTPAQPQINYDLSHQPEVVNDANALLSYVEGQELISDQGVQQTGSEESKKESPSGNLTMINPKKMFIQNNTITQIQCSNDSCDPGIPMSCKLKKQAHSYVHISDKDVPPRAVAVLPSTLVIRRESIYPRRPLHSYVRFGPVKGIMQKIFNGEASELILEAAVIKKPIFLMKKDTDSVTYIDASDKDKSNWLSLLPLGDQNTANVWLYEEENDLYAITTQTLHPRTPLALGYSQEYAMEHGIPVGAPVLDIHKVFAEMSTKPQQWWCYECRRAMPSCTSLQRHMDTYHKDTSVTPRRRYRCKHCSRTFSRIFTLRRHVKRHCSSKKSESLECSEKENVSLKITFTEDNKSEIANHSVDENRLPSDESLQNYTNNLDFSTTLFDTERMPNLDISSSSRSETDFNSFSISYKDGADINNAFDLKMEQNKVHDNVAQEITETVTQMTTCSHCKKTVAREKLRQHTRTCTAKSFNCECGQVFYKKEKLSQHILTEHYEKAPPKNDSLPDTPYKCQECSFTFKRRGMLVNHLRRVHKNMTVTVPLECTVNHYPCVACNKMYRTAHKRDTHVRKHHPECGGVAGECVRSGVRARAPAACAACPREYASRAKLLQHVRDKHPLLAPPVRRVKSSTTVT